MAPDTWQWRAVGYDDPAAEDVRGDGFERSKWTDARHEAERVAEEMRSDKPPYDDIYLERRMVTVGEPERVEPMGHREVPDAA